MKQIFVFLLLTIATLVNSQSKVICEFKSIDAKQHSQSIETLGGILDSTNLDIFSLEANLNKIGTLVNFKTFECKSNCGSHGSTAMLDDSMHRVLYLDSELRYLRRLDSFRLSDSSRIIKQFELAHEIGHHILGHNSLREDRFQNSREVCDTRSKSYNRDKCQYKSTYIHYRRLYESQADRFAGYYLGRHGARIVDIEFYLIEASKNGPRFYPNIAERLESIRQGYSLAREDLKYKRKINLDKICRYTVYEGSMRIDPSYSKKIISQCSKVIVDEKRYKAIDDSGIELLKIQITENCLNLKLRHIGSQDSNVSLIDGDWIAESFPPQRGLKLELAKNNAYNEYAIKDYYFDISKLLVKGGGLITFHIRNQRFRIEY